MGTLLIRNYKFIYVAFACAIIQAQSVSVQRQPKTRGRTKPRMAVCIVGASRTLSSSSVYTSISKLSSTSEAQGLLQPNIDLFVHVSVGASNLSKMRAAMDYLQPINNTLEAGEGPYPVDPPRGGKYDSAGEGLYPVDKYLATPGCQSRFWHYPDVLGKAMNYYYHMKSCHGMLERYEAEAKLQYDVIMFARADLQWLARFPRSVIDAAATRSTTTLQHDYFMVAPRDVATDLATILDDYFTVTCIFKGQPEYVVEDAGRQSGRKHNVGLDWTWEYNQLFRLVRLWDIPKDSYKENAYDHNDYLEEVRPEAAWE